MAFLLTEIAGLGALMGKGAFAELTPDLVDAVLDEGAKLAADVLSPLNRPGDLEGVRLEADGVKTPKGFAGAYRQWVEGGWGGLAASTEFGGQGLPLALATVMQEMWNAANMAFGLCPILSQGVIEALTAHGTDEQKRLYLPKLVSGDWTGTMNLTEPQAGSDLNALKAKAVKQPDGTYKITGTKIFITYGDHDMAENIAPLVLARTPDILAGLGARHAGKPGAPVLVGFAAETEEVIARAREKLKGKRCDLVVANKVGAPGAGFGGDTNRVALVSAAELAEIEGTKDKVAEAILDWILPVLDGRRPRG
jgi:alkylation response protein AidB-like acyl-CoA dehydrogenase